MIALRLHIDDSTHDNGPLRVIPNTHQSGTLSAGEIEMSRRTASDLQLTVTRGGVIAMRSLLLHASSKSGSLMELRVLHFLFGPPQPAFGIRWLVATETCDPAE